MQSLLQTKTAEFEHDGRHYRLTAASVSPSKKARYYYHLDQVRQYLHTEFGIDTSDDNWIQKAYAVNYFFDLQRAAATLVSVRKVECRASEKASWQEDPFPDEWTADPMTFLDNVHEVFLVEAEKLYQELTPRMFRRVEAPSEEEQDAEKNDSSASADG